MRAQTKILKKKGFKSVERLAHFSCGKCNKWWSIADAPTRTRVWYCPWCGTAEKL